MRRFVRILGSRPARALVLFALLMVPWPPFGRAYGRVVSALAGVVVGAGGSPVLVRFTVGGDLDPPADSWKLRIHAEDPGTGRYVGTVLDLRRSGYIACAVFLALALVTPLRPRRKLALLGGGLALLQVLPLLPLLSFFSGKLPVRVFDFGPTLRVLTEIGYHALVAPPGMAYAVPGLVWLLLVAVLDPECLRAIAGTRYSKASPASERLRPAGS